MGAAGRIYGLNLIRAGFGSGLICPRAQTCCALKSSAPSGARQDNYADSGSACKLAGVQIIPLPTLANQILARTFFRSVAHRLRAQPLESSLGRVPQAADCTCNKNFANQIVSVAEDCLSPERTFHGCSLMHFRGCICGYIFGCSSNSTQPVQGPLDDHSPRAGPSG